MKRNKILAYCAAAALVVGAASSCTKDFEEMNTNPFGMTDDMIPLGPRFETPMQSIVYNLKNTAYEYQLYQNLNGDLYSGYMATPTPFGGGRNNATYFMMEGWNALAFERGNTNIMKTIDVIIKESNRVGYVEFAQIAKIIRVEGMHRITDLYGPIPYSAAASGGISTPYDSQEDVYKAFFKELTEASDSLYMFANDAQYAESYALNRFKDYDQVCGGDVKLWNKFANTLRLRLAMRISGSHPAWAKEEGEKALAAPGGLLGDGDKIIAVATTTLRNPVYTIAYNYGDIRVGAPVSSILNGYGDTRIEKYATPITKDIGGNSTTGEYIGIRNGISIPSKDDYTPFSNIAVEESTLTSPLYWMKPSESLFLQAEAALRGWTVPNGNAQSLYEAGITLSFGESGAPMPAGYLSNTNTAEPYIDPFNADNNIEAGSKWLNDVPVQWMNGGEKEKQLQQIITQKWIAMFPDGMEAWAEHRRTGYPKLFPVMQNDSNGAISTEGFVRRIPFPVGEYRTNPTEVAKAVSLLGGPDTGGTKLFWDIDAIVTGNNNIP